MTGSDEEFSDGEIIFEEKTVAFKNNLQVMKITEPEPGEILVNSTSFTSLSSVADSEDWVLAGETPVESPCILLSRSSLEPLISLDLVGTKLYCFRVRVHCYHCLYIIFSTNPVRRSEELRGGPLHYVSTAMLSTFDTQCNFV